jgi:hypothetical protein
MLCYETSMTSEDFAIPPHATSSELSDQEAILFWNGPALTGG